jgi:hypothetical protein
MAALHLLWSEERLSAAPPDEREIAHQVPDPTEALETSWSQPFGLCSYIE